MIEIRSRYARELLQWIIVNCTLFPLSIHCTVLAKKLGWKTYGPKMTSGAISCPAVGEAIRALVKYGYITFTQPKRGWYIISITQTLQTIIDAVKGDDREVVEPTGQVDTTESFQSFAGREIHNLLGIVAQLQTDNESKQKMIDGLSRKYTELNAIGQELLAREQTETMTDRNSHLTDFVERLDKLDDAFQKHMEGFRRWYEKLESIAEIVERHDHILDIAQIVTITTKQLDFLEGRHQVPHA